MIKFFVSFAAWMIFGNWVYDEVKVSFPSFVPTIDSAMEAVAIPTHDQWDKEKLMGAVNGVGAAISMAFPELDAIELKLNTPAQTAASQRASVRQGFERF